jgi:hypothetical protein
MEGNSTGGFRMFSGRCFAENWASLRCSVAIRVVPMMSGGTSVKPVVTTSMRRSWLKCSMNFSSKAGTSCC